MEIAMTLPSFRTRSSRRVDSFAVESVYGKSVNTTSADTGARTAHSST